MGKRPEVSLEKRAEINILLSEGLSQKDIASRLGISQSAVSKIIKRILEYGTYTPKPRPGRPKTKNTSNQNVHDSIFINIKGENEQCYEGEDKKSFSFPFIDAVQDNFYSSLCEIENSIKKEDERHSPVIENEDPKYKLEACSILPMEETTLKLSSFAMEKDESKTYFSNTLLEREHMEKQEERMQMIKPKISSYESFKSKGKSRNKNFMRRENLSSDFVKVQQKRSFIKNNPNFHGFEEETLEEIPLVIKPKKEFYNCNSYDIYENSDEEKEDRSSVKAREDKNKIIFHLKNRYSNANKDTEYFRITEKSIRRKRSKQTKMEMRPMTFVKISERKRSHEKRGSKYHSTLPLKIKFNKRCF